jgi:hypothetical protein
MIMGLAVRRRGPEGNAPMAASKRFGRYKSEKQKSVRDNGMRDEAIDLEPLNEMLERYQERTRPSVSMTMSRSVDVGYGVAKSFVETLDDEMLSSKHIKAVSLQQFPEGALLDDESFGLIFSALISSSPDMDFHISTSHSPESEAMSGFLGTRNSKRVKVWGNVGRFLGAKMVGGSIEVDGDAGDSCGYMMEGGRIVIMGDAGKRVGELMSGGEIYLQGTFESIGEVKHGKIYHKGKLIVDK